MKDNIPKYHEFHWPIIEALHQMGGSASIDELNHKVSLNLRLPEKTLAVPHGDGNISEVEYRMAWARTYLKKVGALENGTRGVWSLTSIGRSFTQTDAAEVSKRVRADSAKLKAEKELKSEISDEDPDEISWKNQLIAVLKKMPADGFERLCQRVLRESGFIKVEVTGRSGDGGIDGAGVLRVNLVSFHVLFQCKRWKDAVSSPVIRDFRGSMIGRADKGLVITTGRFTSDAQKEAVRDGAPAIDLIDGETLCDILKTLKLGVEIRLVETVEIKPEVFFNI